MKDNLKPEATATDRQMEAFCLLLQSAPVEVRAEMVGIFTSEYGPVPDTWEVIVERIVANKGAHEPGVKVRELWAFIGEEADGTEGICARLTPGGMGLPMIGADKDRVTSLRALAQDIARATGGKVTLVKFSVREDIEVILP